ncbi:MAG TPA: hypothetical protein VJO14_03615 [Bacteroidota bacterium]|nr:hypothetical protein [Bacteroidota bacterium]
MELNKWTEPAELTGRTRIFVIAAMAVLVCLFYFSAASHFDYTTDDSYIYYQYARNLTGGDGLSFNAGTPSYGFTSPLWLLIMSAGGAAGADMPFFSKMLDLLFASMSVMLVFFLSFELTRDVAVSFCTSLAFSVNAWLLRWAGSGLETSLAVFLLLAFFRYLLRNEYAASAGVLGLLTLVRPEASLLLVPMLMDLRLNSVDLSRAWRTGVRVVSVWLVIVLPWVLYAYAAFGSVVPTTFGAKHAAAFDPGDMADSAVDIVKTLGSADGAAVVCLAVPLFVFWMRYRKRRVKVPAPPDGEKLPLPFYHFRQSFVGIAWIVILPLFYVLFSVNVVSRYLLLVTPVILIMGFFFLHELLLDRPPMLRYGLVLALTALIMMQNQFVYKKYAVPHLEAFALGIETCLKPIGFWLGEHTPPGTVILTADVGAIGYFSRRTICDFNGIVSPGAAPGRKDNDTFTGLLRERRWGGICEPSYIVHRGPVPGELKDVNGLVPVMSRPFAGLSVSDSRTVFFTLYRVEHPATEKLLTRR